MYQDQLRLGYIRCTISFFSTVTHRTSWVVTTREGERERKRTLLHGEINLLYSTISCMYKNTNFWFLKIFYFLPYSNTII